MKLLLVENEAMGIKRLAGVLLSFSVFFIFGCIAPRRELALKEETACLLESLTLQYGYAGLRVTPAYEATVSVRAATKIWEHLSGPEDEFNYRVATTDDEWLSVATTPDGRILAINACVVGASHFKAASELVFHHTKEMFGKPDVVLNHTFFVWHYPRFSRIEIISSPSNHMLIWNVETVEGAQLRQRWSSNSIETQGGYSSSVVFPSPPE